MLWLLALLCVEVEKRVHVVADKALVVQGVVISALDQIEQRGGFRRHITERRAGDPDDDRILGRAQQLRRHYGYTTYYGYHSITSEIT